MYRVVTGFVLLWLALASPLAADRYPLPGDLFVNDLAEVIPPETETRIRDELRRLKSETGIEMTVLTVRSREDFDPSPSLNDFATGLFNAWGIGNAGTNDGILVFVATEGREMRIVLGKGYNQGYDVLAEDIVSRYFVPDLREGNFGRGIETGTAETVARIARRHSAKLEPQPLPAKPGASINGLVPYAIGAIAALIVATQVFGRRLRDASYALRRCPACGQRGMTRHRHSRANRPGREDGVLTVTTACRHCEFRDERETRARATGGSEGGGGRSFGGGSSSGGGASGKW
ncbi:MAG: TPM domain-containing protein [Paracoccaceae bacterium]